MFYFVNLKYTENIFTNTPKKVLTYTKKGVIFNISNKERAHKAQGWNIMKRTSSMIYKETTESRELFLVATNDGELYRRQIVPTIKNLGKKLAKGIFDKNKAIDAFYYVAQSASQQYKKDFGYMFTVQERFTAATDILEHFMEDIEAEAEEA